jgi:hypothetical protein
MIFSIIKAWLFGIISIMPPYFGFLLTNHLITEYDKDKRTAAIIMLFTMMGMSMYIGHPIYIMIFLAIYGIIIVGYLLSRRVRWLKNLGEFDKAVLVSIVTMCLITLVYYINIDYITSTLTEIKSQVIQQLESMFGGDKALVEETVETTFKGFFNILFIYTFITYLLTSFTNKSKETVKKWTINYVHLLWFIGAYVAIYLFKIDNTIINNILKACQNVYIIYGFLAAYRSVTKKEGEKSKVLGIIFASLLYLLSPVILFIYGSISSFDLFKKRD